MTQRYYFLYVVTAFFAFGSPELKAQTDYRIVGYYPAWNRTILPADKIQTSNLTHIVHAFAWPTVTGSIQADANVPDAALVAAVHAAGKKVLIAFGGWGHDAGFVPVAANPAIRAVFIENVMNFLTTHEYDGVDLDWEFPSTAAQRESLTVLVKEIRRAMDAIDSSYLLTMAVPISNWSGQWIDFPAIVSSMDWFNAMAYDVHGSWTAHAGHNAPLYAPSNDYDGSAHQGIQYLTITRGIPKQKITLGVPFYGKQFTATAMYAPQSGVSDVTYSTVHARILSGWLYQWDDVSKVPYLKNGTNTAVITFDDSVSLKLKCRYVKDNGLSGIMIWALGQDVVLGKQPLLEAIGNEMRSPTGIRFEAAPSVHHHPSLESYPNPFNGTATIRFDIVVSSAVRLTIHDLLGRTVATLAEEHVKPGRYSVHWNAHNVSSGMYLCRLSGGGTISTTRMLLIK